MAEGTSLPQKSSLATQSLSTDDLADVMTEIVEAQNQSRFIGLKLKVPNYIVDGIHQTYQQPKDHLYYIVLEFLKQVDPEPTWAAIADALKSPLVGFSRLAQKIERKYYSPPPPTQEVGVGKLQWSQGVWFQEWHGEKQPPKPLPTIKATDRPTLPQLINFETRSGGINIAEQIGTSYRNLGLHLLEDANGVVTKAIRDQYHHDAATINYEILQRWIQGKGRQPVQWSTLIDVLKKIQLSQLAREIADNMQ